MYPGPPQPSPQPRPGPPRRPAWARKRVLLPGLFLTWFFGFALGTAGESGSAAPEERAVASATPRPTATATVTETAAPEAEPAPTVTETEKVKVRTTVTVTAKPHDNGTSGSGSGSGSGGSGSVHYGNCSEARAAGAAPVHRGEPGYGRHLDRDGDGVGCDV
ncbi:excalibur calcium-binding domain-containing protein [Streptomyces winkii]|uniref:excalibur calcium-binding domain-containing protein n=1 Tax=Streptomyces winkii TaxID=3051178 RepID=UPI0028D65CA8|nr:excalibur calcium-binding domain-containing protein [Streptomyces sp. DSM 40971]